MFATGRGQMNDIERGRQDPIEVVEVDLRCRGLELAVVGIEWCRGVESQRGSRREVKQISSPQF